MKYSILSLILTLLFLGHGDLLAANDFRERIYVQTDKQVYLAGELLWLKLCVTDATGIPVSFSKVGYVELLDESTALVQAKIEIKEGIGEGWLELPALLPTGYYRLVAYTRYMRNESDTVFFRKTIGVVNTFRKDETIPTDTLIKATSPDISGNTLWIKLLFHEGNKVISGFRVYLLMCIRWESLLPAKNLFRCPTIILFVNGRLCYLL